MNARKTKGFCFGCVFAIAMSAVASPAPFKMNDVGVQALSFAGAYRTVARGTDSLYYNPASIAKPKKYQINTDYFYRTYEQHQLGLALVDSKSGFVSAGFGYNLGIFTGPTNEFSHNASVGIALPIVPEFLFIGIVGRYLHAPERLSGEETLDKFTGDAGVLLSLPFGLSFAAVGHNLYPTRTSLAPIGLGFGSSLSLLDVTLAFDYLIDDFFKTTPNNILSACLEYAIMSFFPIRAGYSWSKDDKSHLMAFGAGLMSEVINFDLLFQQGISDTSQRIYGIQLSFNV